MVKFATSTFGGKANADFIRGLKATNPVLADEAKEVNKVLRKFYRDFLKRYKHYRHGAHGVMAGTTPTFDEESGAEIPSGFEKFTVPLARAVDRLLQFKAPEEQEAQKDRVSISEVARGQAGIWAKPIELELPKPRHVDGKLGRKRVPANIGKNPRRINRMLLDPERRVFDRRAKGIGGIILIDQSGSMSLSEEDIWNLIESAPGCVIIGYSHQRDSAGVPNIWVLAERGRVVEDLSEVPRNGGNGVDGPAIRFALTKRRNNEPFIWVCDGDVTDGKDDMTYPNLTAECVTLVHTHGIHTVDSVEEAVDALKGVARGNRPKTRYTGELRRVARRKGLL
jgi:hypothetical protein